MRRRPRARKPAAGVSLFPFLAVLICTMGGLIVLLVMVVQQARRSADQAADNAAQQQHDAQQTAELQEALEDRQWQRDILVKQQQEKSAELADRRSELSHLEDHLRQLQKQWRGLIAAAEQLENGDPGREDQRRRAEQKLRQTTLEIQAAKRDLQQAKAKIARKQDSFAILPYDGPNGTRRRPIYLECTADGITIQPEGVRITSADLTGPQGPGNPMAAALRQVRDYLTQTVRGAEGEPYPLLLVRPDGVDSYNLARRAMSSWDDEFGYELIRSDLKVEFPEVNPALARSLEDTIAAARDRQAKLVQAMPNRFRRSGGGGIGIGSGGGGMVASPRGGFVPAGGSRGGRGIGSGRGGSGRLGSGRSGSGRFSATSSGSSPAGRSAPASNAPSGSRGTGNSNTGSDFDGSAPNGSSAGQRAAQGTGQGTGQRAGQGNDPRTAQRGGARSGSPTAGANQRGGNQGGSGNQQASGGAGGSSATPGGRQASANAGGQANAGAFGGAGSSGSGGGSAGGGNCASVAEQRGDNWALPGRGAGATGVTRPIRIACLPDRLLILPEAGQNRLPRVVPLPGPTPRHVDDFVEAVWKHVDNWGIALAGGYWKPVLNVEVAPGGQQRFADLQQLLRDSGLEVRQRNQPVGDRP